MKKIILIISLLFLTTGCSYQEINDLAIASAMGIDLKDDDYILTAQIMNIQKSSDGSMIPDSTIYTSKGMNIPNSHHLYIKRKNCFRSTKKFHCTISKKHIFRTYRINCIRKRFNWKENGKCSWFYIKKPIC